MKAVGFFRQRDGGAYPGPDVLEAIAVPLTEEERRPVVRYLRAGTPLAVTGSRTVDVLAPERGEVSGVNVLTDGEFAWPEDLAYYVETYGARPPRDFLDVVDRAGLPGSLDLQALKALRPAFREAMLESRGGGATDG